MKKDEIRDVRRANLKEWVEANGTPAKEKSYFSQLLGGEQSFGERAARRLEDDYKMGEGFLDKPKGETVSEIQNIPENFIDANEIIKLVDLYRQSTPKGRAHIMQSAQLAQKISVARRGKTAED